MKRRSLPLWLLRDVPALLGVMFSFWPLMILVIRSGFAAMRGQKVPKSVFDAIPILLAHAEARLDFALWREAYRRLGWSHRLVTFSAFAPPADWLETEQRFEAYRRANMNLEAIVRAYVEHLRAQYGISQREAAFASAYAPVRAPLATPTKSSLAVRRGRWIATSSSRDGGGCVRTCARGPPLNSNSGNQFQPTSHAPRARSHRHAYPRKGVTDRSVRTTPSPDDISIVCVSIAPRRRTAPSSNVPLVTPVAAKITSPVTRSSRP